MGVSLRTAEVLLAGRCCCTLAQGAHPLQSIRVNRMTNKSFLYACNLPGNWACCRRECPHVGRYPVTGASDLLVDPRASPVFGNSHPGSRMLCLHCGATPGSAPPSRTRYSFRSSTCSLAKGFPVLAWPVEASPIQIC